MDCSPPGPSVPGDSPGKHSAVGCHALLQGNLPNSGVEPRSPSLQAGSLPSEPPEKPKDTGVDSLSLLQRNFWTQELGQGNDHAVAAAAKSLQLCTTLCDPIDGSPSGSPVPGILQARTLEASQSFTIYRSLLKLMSIESMMPSNHLMLCCPLLLLPSILPSIRESALCIGRPKY